MSFAVGQRVICTQFDSAYNVDLTGYYGHVVGRYNKAWMEIPVVLVSLQGCSTKGPADATHLDPEGNDPFPFYENELQHAD